MNKNPGQSRLSLLKDRKSGAAKICALTAYDAPTAKLLDASGVDLLFVGDSVGTNVLGYATEREVTIDDMLHHTRAVRRGAPEAVILTDLPYGSYASDAMAVENASHLTEAGACIVKLEGPDQSGAIQSMVAAGITVCAHLGFTPQTIPTSASGKGRVQGRSLIDASALVESALALERAGASFLVLELVPCEVAKVVTKLLKIPTIGIGAGPDCDGQVLIIHDVLGISEVELRIAKRFADGRSLATAAVGDYCSAVRNGTFPTLENGFLMAPEVAELFLAKWE